MGQHTYKQRTVCLIGLGRRGSHPTGGGKAPGEMLYARTCFRRPVWDWRRADGLVGFICVAPEGVSASYPLKPQDACTSRGGGLRYLWSISPMFCTLFSFFVL